MTKAVLRNTRLLDQLKQLWYIYIYIYIAHIHVYIYIDIYIQSSCTTSTFLGMRRHPSRRPNFQVQTVTLVITVMTMKMTRISMRN